MSLIVTHLRSLSRCYQIGATYLPLVVILSPSRSTKLRVTKQDMPISHQAFDYNVGPKLIPISTLRTHLLASTVFHLKHAHNI